MSLPLVFSIQSIYSIGCNWTLLQLGFPIRKSPDQKLFASPRSLSQLTTSFIDFTCQGIHHMLLVTLLTPFYKPLIVQIDDIFIIRYLQLLLRYYLKLSMSKSKKTKSCGADRAWTCDPLDANQVLSQLSYSPIFAQYKCSMWVWVDSNYRPPPYQGGALTNWATNPMYKWNENCVKNIKN